MDLMPKRVTKPVVSGTDLSKDDRRELKTKRAKDRTWKQAVTVQHDPDDGAQRHPALEDE